MLNDFVFNHCHMCNQGYFVIVSYPDYFSILLYYSYVENAFLRALRKYFDKKKKPLFPFWKTTKPANDLMVSWYLIICISVYRTKIYAFSFLFFFCSSRLYTMFELMTRHLWTLQFASQFRLRLKLKKKPIILYYFSFQILHKWATESIAKISASEV